MSAREKWALISVYHKEGIVDFAKELLGLGWKILASGGTARALDAAGISVKDVASLVGGEAILGHRVVTLSREVHAGLLADLADPKHIKELEERGIPVIDMVVCDFYPMADVIATPGATIESVVELTDIGGPTMVSAAAKGFRIVICRPQDRQRVLRELASNSSGDLSNTSRQKLRAIAEFEVAKYRLTSAIFHGAGRFNGIIGREVVKLPKGENGWQSPAYLYSTETGDPLALDKFMVVEGAPPSYNNWVDLDRLLQTASHIARVYENIAGAGTAIAVGGKHGNPCGAAAGPDRGEVLKKMIAGDPLAIFGGLVMVNFELNSDLCEPLIGKMLDGIVAPGFSTSAVSMLRRKSDKCRFIANPSLYAIGRLDQANRFRYVRGGFLVQPNYTFVPDFEQEILKNRIATLAQERDMALAWAIGSTSNSNTITLVKDGQLIGNGVGQQDRVGAANLAITRARRSGHDIAGSAAYSDSFFPFPDGPQTLIDAGVTAIFTSSGSVRDKEIIDVCVKSGVVLYMVPDPVGRGFFGH